MFYVGCHRPTTTLLLYPNLRLTVNGALAEFQAKKIKWALAVNANGR